MSNVVDLDEYSLDRRFVNYDPVFAMTQVRKMNAHQHTCATTEALEALVIPTPLPSASPRACPPEWKGCRNNIYCVRNCGPDGHHLKEDGSSGGRGQCRMRSPPSWYHQPEGEPTFNEAKYSKKRKRYCVMEAAAEAAVAKAAAVQQAAAEAAAVQQAAAEAAAVQQAAAEVAAVQQAAAQQAATQPSEMETLRNAIRSLQEEVNTLKEWKANMLASFVM
jgi:hypothetical protein